MAHSITISWSASPLPVSGYNVRRGSSPGNESSVPLNTEQIVGTSYVDNTVELGQTYSYKITSIYNGVEEPQPISVIPMTVPLEDYLPTGSVELLELSQLPTGSQQLPTGSSQFPHRSNLHFDAVRKFAVLAGTSVTNAPGSSTSVHGDVGVSPGAAISGFEAPAAIDGMSHAGDADAAAAQVELAAVFANGMARSNSAPQFEDILQPVVAAPVQYGTEMNVMGGMARANSRSQVINTPSIDISSASHVALFTQMALPSGIALPTGVSLPSGVSQATGASPSDYSLPADLGGLVLLPGVYNAVGPIAITGQLVLDAQGDSHADFIFQLGSTLTTTGSNSSIVLQGDASASHVFWLLGDSAALNNDTTFIGNILAKNNITVNQNVSINGKLLAMSGAISLNADKLTMSDEGHSRFDAGHDRFDVGHLTIWNPSTNYSYGQSIFDGVRYQKVIIAGLSGTATPVWGNTHDATTQDGSVVWKASGDQDTKSSSTINNVDINILNKS
jgi:hypothetical protein